MSTIGPQRGTLLIHGGGHINDEFKIRFKELAGVGLHPIVCIPTADNDEKLDNFQTPITHVPHDPLFGIPATYLHTRDIRVADSDFFVDPLRRANGVFFHGGRQPRLADAYLNTATHRELTNLLNRGGVIAGSSAGATILGSFMVRNQGAPDFNPDVMVDQEYPTEGFGFIKGIAIDQHVTQRNRESHLGEVLQLHSELLGIGIDEDTAIILHGNIFEVIGSGKVFIRDGTSPYFTMVHGQQYDIQARTPCL